MPIEAPIHSDATSYRSTNHSTTCKNSNSYAQTAPTTPADCNKDTTDLLTAPPYQLIIVAPKEPARIPPLVKPRALMKGIVENVAITLPTNPLSTLLNAPLIVGLWFCSHPW